MNITEKKLAGSRKKLTVILNEKEHKKYRQYAIQEAGKELKIDGFRSGKIPEELVEERLGLEGISYALYQHALPKIYAEIVMEQDIHVLEKPNITIESFEPTLQIQIEVTVFPEIELGNYSKIKIPKKEAAITSKDIDFVVGNLQKKGAEWKPVDRKIKNGDKVLIDFEGISPEGEPIENMSSKQYELVLGEGSFIDDFEKKIIGVKKGEEKTFTISFSQKYFIPSVAGKKVTFKVQVHEVFEGILPEVNEEFVEKMVGTKKSVEALRDEIKGYIEEQKKKEAAEKQEQEILETLQKMVKVEMPDIFLTKEVDILLDQYKMQIAQQGMTWEMYLEHAKKTEEQKRKEFEPEATKRIKIQLGLLQVIEKEQLQVLEDEIAKDIEHIRKHDQEKKTKRDEKDYTPGGRLWAQVRSQKEIEKALQFFRDLAEK